MIEKFYIYTLFGNMDTR